MNTHNTLMPQASTLLTTMCSVIMRPRFFLNEIHQLRCRRLICCCAIPAIEQCFCGEIRDTTLRFLPLFCLSPFTFACLQTEKAQAHKQEQTSKLISTTSLIIAAAKFQSISLYTLPYQLLKLLFGLI